MFLKSLHVLPTSLLIIILLFSISCSKTQQLNPSSEDMSVEEILEKSKTIMHSLSSYQLDLEHPVGVGTIVGETGLILSEASVVINIPDEIYIEGNLLFGNIVLKTKYIKTKSKAYYLNPITQNWELIESETNPLSLAVDGLNEILFSTIDQITSPVIDNSEKNNYIVKGSVPSNIFNLLLEEVLDNSLVTKLTIDRNTHHVHKIELSGQVSKYDEPDIIRRLTISNFDKPINISDPTLK